MAKKLYDWQEECLKRWFDNNGRGMVQAVTGSGKTLLALTAAARLDQKCGGGLSVKIVVPTSSLMRQWSRALKEFLLSRAPAGTDPAVIQRQIGMRGAGNKAPASCKYMIYVINSARYELARQILSDLQNGSAVLLIADECHRYASGQNSLIFEFLPYIKAYEDRFFSLGLSATLPSGPARDYLASVLGRRVYSYGIKQAASMNTVCKYDIYHISLSFERSEAQAYGEITDQMNYVYQKLLRTQPFLKNLSPRERFDMLRSLAGSKHRQTAKDASSYLMLSYKRKSVVCLASARIACACSLVERLDSTEKILIFGERIRQADDLYRLLRRKYPGQVGCCHSQMGTQANQNVLNRFRDGELRILIACRSIDEGVDVPDASIGIVLSGSSVQRQRIQRLGRIIRNAEGKDRASLYYLHLEDTTEERFFLPDAGESSSFSLKYHTATREFEHARYDRAAAKLLDNLAASGADPAVLAEARRCLRLGSVRGDWIPGRFDMDGKIKSAGSTSGRNYWLCMKEISCIVLQNTIDNLTLK